MVGKNSANCVKETLVCLTLAYQSAIKNWLQGRKEELHVTSNSSWRLIRANMHIFDRR